MSSNLNLIREFLYTAVQINQVFLVSAFPSMVDTQKLVLMVQPIRLQGLIWQSVLRSQRLSVIWESPDSNLQKKLIQLKAAGLPLPDLLLIDVGLANFNLHSFIRWSRETCPQVKVILVNAAQNTVSLSDRQLAVHQGAADLLPGFQRDNLVSSVSQGVQRVLKVLDQALDNSALIPVLLTIKRELDSLQSSNLDEVLSLGDSVSPTVEGILPPPQQPLAKLQNGKSVLGKELPKSNSVSQRQKLPDDESPPVRKYRGRAY